MVAAADLSDPERRAAVAEVLRALRDSAAWRKACALLRPLCLSFGHTRPSGPLFGAGIFQQQKEVHQPGSAASPAVSEIREIKEQLEKSLHYRHPASELADSLTPPLDAASEWLCHHRADVSTPRTRRRKDWMRAAELLAPWDARLRALSRAAILACNEPHVKCALVACAAECMGWPDQHLVEHCVLGCPPCGDLPDSGVFEPHEDPSVMDLSELDHSRWLPELERRVAEKAARSELSDLASLHDRTLKEVVDGWAVPIGDRADLEREYAAELAAGRCRPMERFPVWQKGKLRPCDNGRSSLHNACTHLHEKLRLAGADFPARVAHRFYVLLGDGDWGMGLGTEDVASAYRRAMCSERGLTVVAQWNPDYERPGGGRGRVEYYHIRGFNFGLKSAVLWWNRLAAFTGEVWPPRALLLSSSRAPADPRRCSALPGIAL